MNGTFAEGGFFAMAAVLRSGQKRGKTEATNAANSQPWGF
jgi:hypothetical protein